jgi:hypothetical protein
MPETGQDLRPQDNDDDDDDDDDDDLSSSDDNEAAPAAAPVPPPLESMRSSDALLTRGASEAGLDP